MMVHHCTVHVFLFSYLIDKYSARIITETGKIMNTITKKLPKGLTSTSLSSMYITEPAETFFFCRCSIRFPSTSIRLFFQSLIEEPESMESDEMPSPPKMKPLNINIPPSHMIAEGIQDDRGHHRMRASPPCSPAGTISVPNSCPTSPNRY